jgi:hypothetical protein
VEGAAEGSRLSLYHSRTMKSGSSILLRFILCWPYD